MDESDIRNLLEAGKRGQQTIDSTVAKLRRLPYEDLGFAKVDHHRGLRQGYAEVVFARGKTSKQVTEIVRAMLRAKASHNILITRASKKIFAAVRLAARAAKLRAEFHELSGTISIERSRTMQGKGLILIVTAGTSVIPVAEEALVTAHAIGNRAEPMFDGGVAGLHLLLELREIMS